ncbi:MAG: glycogen/starch synthase [Patescibacteria group bacterium]|nr:glycogen/starch synthase [Patescibacteria group bacterium]
MTAIKDLKIRPDVVHCHDWHTALIPTFIDEYSLKYASFANIKTLYTIHNLANQGIVGLDILDYASLSRHLTPAIMEDYYDQDGQVIDLMKIGILSADLVNTVSPNYAKEILGKEYGAGMEEYLLRRKKHLSGILNGIDIDFFNPQKDKYIKKKYNAQNFFTARKINKADLQAVSRLPKKDVPVFGIVTRLVAQKGLDILRDSLESLLPHYDFQLVVLGTGSAEIERDFKQLQKKYPQKVKSNILFDAPLAQKIYAGSDFFLMPSRFEPCGLGQMIAMRYGSIPLVRQTGGLKDTVKDNQTGFVFKNYQAKDLEKTLVRALKFYGQKSRCQKMVKKIMQEDFSWERSARQYLKLYQKLK